MADKPRCNRKRKQCSKCEYRYTLADKPLTECPQCGFSRLCRNIVEWEGKACRKHGGASLPAGPDHPRYKHGKRSKLGSNSLPPTLAKYYEQSLNDPALLSTRKHIALLDARWKELQDRLASGSHSGYWQALDKLRGELESVRAALDTTNDPDTLALLKVQSDSLLNDLLRTIQEARSYDLAWKDIAEVHRDICASTKNEVSKMKDAQAMVSAGRVLEIAAAMVRLVELHVADQGARTKIAAGLERIVTIQPRE